MVSSSTRHKIAITISILLSVGLIVYADYYIASFLESQNMHGINLYVDNFLRWSSMSAIIIALLTTIFTWFNNKFSRTTLIILTSILITDAIFSLIVYFVGRPLVVRGYKRLFTKIEFIARASDFEINNHCCGWNNISSSIISDCQSTIPCIQIVRKYWKGKNTLVTTLCFGISIFLLFYVLVGHVLIMSTNRATGYTPVGGITP